MQHDEPATKRDLEELKQELSARIDTNGRKIDGNAAKIESNAAKIEANGAAISRVTAQVVINSEKLTQLTAKVDKFDGYFNSIMNTLDGLVADFARFDQERAATNSWLVRVESNVRNNTRRIEKIETKLA